MNPQTHQRLDSLDTNKLSQSLKSMKWGQNGDKGQQNDIRHQVTYKRKIHHKDNIRQVQNKYHATYQHQHQRKPSQQVHYVTSYTSNTKHYKKNKDSQVNRLQELKQEYEILKNLTVEQSVIYTHKTQKQHDSSQRSQASSSKRSLHNGSERERLHAGRNIIQYEKKQLQLMLNNSMAKIQELLRNQIQYKRKIHQLSLNKNTDNSDQIDELIRKHREEHHSLVQRIEDSKKQEERLRNLNRTLTQKINMLQSQLLTKNTQIRRLELEKRKFDENLYLDKQKLMTAQLQVKRLKMEIQILEKDKLSEINYWKRMMENSTASHPKQSNDLQISKLKEEIKLKDHRYDMLLTQLQHFKLKNSKRPSFSESPMYKQLLSKIEGMSNHQDKNLRHQIENLRENLKNLQNAGNEDLQSRIKSLQNFIEMENKQKLSFMQQLRRMSINFDEIQQENKNLKKKLQNYQNENKRLRRQLQGFKKQLDESQNAKMTLSLSQADNNNNLVQKIKSYEKYQYQLKELRAQYTDLKQQYKMKQIEYQDEIRSLRRQLDEHKFKIEKQIKENKFNLQLAQTKSKAEAQLAKKQIQRAIQQRDQWKRQFDNMKAFYENKLSQLRKQMQQVNEEWSRTIQTKDNQLINVRGSIDGDLASLRKKYQDEQSGLIGRLDSLMQSNQRFAKENAKLIHIESQLYELRQQNKRMLGLTTNIDHLWSVKETEYGNVHLILQEML